MEDKKLGTTRDGFGIALKEVGEDNVGPVVLCADLSESTRVHWFREAFPDRFIETGVAEENMVGVAAGLALAGKIPVASSYATFSPGNSWGPLRSSICYTNANVKLAGGHAGFSAGPDGATHQGLEDIALTRVLPNMTVVVPADQEEARKATHAIIKHKGPCYIRLGKSKIPHTSTSGEFEIGKAVVMKPGTDVTLIACGTMIWRALKAAETLEKKNISARVINMHTIKPLDTEAVDKAAKETKAIVTIEEHQVAGGLGSAVAEHLASAQNRPPMKIMGVEDSFGESGTDEELIVKHKLTPKDIAREASSLVS